MFYFFQSTGTITGAARQDDANYIVFVGFCQRSKKYVDGQISGLVLRTGDQFDVPVDYFNVPVVGHHIHLIGLHLVHVLNVLHWHGCCF